MVEPAATRRGSSTVNDPGTEEPQPHRDVNCPNGTHSFFPSGGQLEDTFVQQDRVGFSQVATLGSDEPAESHFEHCELPDESSADDLTALMLACAFPQQFPDALPLAAQQHCPSCCRPLPQRQSELVRPRFSGRPMVAAK